MKKLFLMAAVMGLGLAARAAYSTTVTLTANGIYDGEELVRWSRSAYFFVANELTRSKLCDELRNGGSIETLSHSGSNLGYADEIKSDPPRKNGVLDYTCTYYNKYDLDKQNVAVYFALIDTDNERVYVSNEVTAYWGNSATYAFGDQTTASQASTKSEFAGTAGWYSYAEVPEPTSGLLMLLGMAGLALKRRRA